MPAEKSCRTNESRKSSKPAMERRRRQRINQSLSELKCLILDTMKKSDNPRQSSKLEKADILSLTVSHIISMQRHQSAMSASLDPNIISKYRAGFTDCANEVCRFLSHNGQQVNETTMQLLITHLNHYLTSLNSNLLNQPDKDRDACSAGNKVPAFSPDQTSPIPKRLRTPVIDQIAASPSPPATVPQQQQQLLYGGLQVTPTRLPSGQIAFVINPTNLQQQHQQPEVACDTSLYKYSCSDNFLMNSNDIRSTSSRVTDFSMDKNDQYFFSAAGSQSPDSFTSNCSDGENVWRPW